MREMPEDECWALSDFSARMILPPKFSCGATAWADSIVPCTLQKSRIVNHKPVL